ncbi:hypothetical protein NQ318_012085 [Aromia moschata]|uniref:DUF4817 domain-containing protein n=1 Tax=Aromia moschata TaxID=1265417 RepID=A0AAV8XMA1_9CUCU|nr:hypothetical protein NQ318_012085 [Aromia moschata]
MSQYINPPHLIERRLQRGPPQSRRERFYVLQFLKLVDYPWACFYTVAKSNLVCMLYSEFETKCYFKLVKMSYLTESLKIEILMMIGYGDRARTQCEVVRLFRETHPDLPPLNQGTISTISREGHVRKVPSKRQAVVDDDTKLNLLLALEENPITPARQLARDSKLNHNTVLKILKYEKKRPYKMQAVQELLEDDPDRWLLGLSARLSLNYIPRQSLGEIDRKDIAKLTEKVQVSIYNSKENEIDHKNRIY